MSTTLTIESPEAMARLGGHIARQMGAGDVVVLSGELGAGKTTLTRGIGAALDVRGSVTSPTFVLARTHRRASGPALVHVDAYRLRDARELDDLDLDFAASIVVVEWGAGLIDQVVDSWLAVTIERPTGHGGVSVAVDGDEDDAPVEPRRVSVTGVGDRWADLGWLHASGD